jgi:hypothetical protein
MCPEPVHMRPEPVEGQRLSRFDKLSAQQLWRFDKLSAGSAHMASASYTSTVPPDCTTGHPRALSAASVNESALMIE